MQKAWLSFFEVHVEKFILGLTGAFLLFMLWTYLVNSPNKVKYGNQEVSPRELDQAILADAEALQRSIERAAPPPQEKIQYAARLRQEHARGIFDAGPQAPAPPPALRLAATFGEEIVVPGLKEEEAPASIALVTPLKPSQPKLSTGIAKVLRVQTSLTEQDDSAKKDDGEEKEVTASEVAWVTVAAYFDTKTQRNEMTKAGYAPFRANPYIVRMDVQRQEMLASGEWSPWKLVGPTKATPRLEIPTPVIDDQSGAVVNKEELLQAFHLVRAEQNTLMQPPFYEVEAGDDWTNPLEVEPEEEQTEDRDTRLADQRKKRLEEQRRRARGRRSAPATPARRGGMARGGRGRAGGGIGVIGGGSFRGAGEAAGGYGSGRASQAKQKREGQQQAREDLKEARRALKAKDYGQVQQLANRVLNNEYARRSDQNAAQKLLDDVEKRIAKQQRQEGGGMIAGAGRRMAGGGRLMGGGEMIIGGGGFRGRGMNPAAGRGGRGGRAEGPVELFRSPENQQPALWFHDDTVESGKTYRYRTRVCLWNRYVGNVRPLRNPEDAKRPILVGEWSLPSDPITVTPTTYFFARGPRPGKDSASVEVWKWREGEWLKQTFDVAVGDVIGGVRKVKLDEWDDDGKQIRADIDFTTGAVVLDLRFDEPIKQRVPAGKAGFNYSEKTTLVIVYLDPADGQVKEKLQLFDRYDPTRKKLEAQAG